MEGSRFLQKIFRAYFPGYREQHSLPLKHLKAATALMSCRTEDQGSSVYVCPEDDEVKQIHHSCRHRSCPSCAGRKQVAWLERQCQKLFPCTHYHIIFTIPHEYLWLWQYNTGWFARALFKACQQTLFELLADSKYLGAKPGLIMALHTWGRQLNLHPHMHCLITGGGLTDKQEWKSVTGDFLLPIGVVKAVYRGKVQALLLDALRANELKLPPDKTPQSTMRCVKQLYKKSWSVRIQEPYPYGQGVLHYLSRYLSGGPLKAEQIIQADDQVVIFSYKDHRVGRTKQLKLEKNEFIRRILSHVPEPGLHTVRHYGLYAPASKANLAEALLKDTAEQTPGLMRKKLANPLDYQVKCPCCGLCMVLVYQFYKRWGKGNSYKKSIALSRRARFVQPNVQADVVNVVPP